jgi:hypothetical protein
MPLSKTLCTETNVWYRSESNRHLCVLLHIIQHIRAFRNACSQNQCTGIHVSYSESTEAPRSQQILQNCNGADMLLFMNLAEMHVFYFLHLNRDLVTIGHPYTPCVS